LKPKIPFHKVIETWGYPVVSKEVSGKIYEIRNTNSEKLRNKRLYGDEKGFGKLSEKWKFLIDADFKISNHCCRIIKKLPVKKYQKESGRVPFTGIMAKDSFLRQTSYLRYGCNAFTRTNPISVPLSFWLEEDVWKYIKKYSVPYSSIYDMGFTATGCMFCMFGVHFEKGENRLQRMRRTHPKHYDYCINKLGCGKVLDFLGVDYKSKVLFT